MKFYLNDHSLELSTKQYGVYKQQALIYFENIKIPSYVWLLIHSEAASLKLSEAL